MLALLATSLSSLASPNASATVPPKQALEVFAAASLRETFTELGHRFEAAHPGTQVLLNFAGSQELRTQIEQGAAADVFASADLVQMESLQRQNLVLEASCFAENEPVLAVPANHPRSFRGLAQLSQVHRLVLGAPEVPIGRYADQILELGRQRFGPGWARAVRHAIVSRELDTRQVLTKVQLGEADAAIVYRTDARVAAAAIEALSIPPELNVRAKYPIAVLPSSPHPALAREWVELILSSEGQRVLQEAGFLPPSPLGDGGAR